MIEEALAWLRLDCDAAAQRLGYQREAAALRVRHRRCAVAWRNHIEHTRRALLEAAREHCRQRPGGTAVLLGPGPLRDVPATELLGLFDRLRLVDTVIHPEMRALARTYPDRVQLVGADITGCIELLARASHVVPEPVFPKHTVEGAGWIASINLWSQLPLLPCAWLARQGVADATIERFGQDLLRAHLREVAATSIPFCIIAEIVDRWFDPTGKEIDRVDRSELFRYALEAAGAETNRWEWAVNPTGELAGGRVEIREVVVVNRAIGMCSE